MRFYDSDTGEWAVYYEDDNNNSSWRVTDHSRNFFFLFTEFTSIMSDSAMLNLYLKYLEPLDRWRTG